jgi:hypothetical protein
MQEQKHSVMLEQKKSLTVSGVESVASFSEVKIVLTLLGGERMTVIGTGLKISGFSKASGSFTAEGELVGISYGGKSLAARIFK